MSRVKRNALLILAAGGLLTVLLAMSVANLVLLPGQPFPFGQLQLGTPATYPVIPGGDLFILLMQGIIALALILLPIYIIYSLLTAEGRERLLVHLVIIVALLVVAHYLQTHKRSLDSNGTLQTSRSASQFLAGNQSASAQDEPVFSPNPPSWLSAAIILAISVVVALAILGGARLYRQRLKRSGSPLKKVAQDAQSAIESLQAGNDLKQTIIRCYQDMNWIVKVETGMARESSMTPHEFEERLVKHGLPRQGVQRLTRLFEQVRYGSLSAGASEEDEAVACLTEIINACHTLGKRV